MRHPLIFIAVLLATFIAKSQEISILNSAELYPISGVAIYNQDQSTTTISTINGKADLSAFGNEESITFKHISHQTLTLTKSQIEAQNWVITMQINPGELDEVILSVTKFAQNKRDVAQQVVTVTSKDVLLTNPQTAADLLESSGQVYVQKSQLGGGSPMIRGFSTNRVLIAVDGIRFNNAIFRAGNVQNVISLDPFSIDRTEVILGPGSVVYGSDAVGGVMNFYTKKPAFSFVDGYSFSGNALARYSTANDEKTGHLDFNIGMKQWAFLTSVSYSDYSDLTMGSHGPDDYLRTQYVERINGQDVVINNSDPERQISSGFNQINFMQKVRFSPTEIWNFDLGLFYTTTGDIPRYDRLIRRSEGELQSAQWYYGPQEWLSGNIQITKEGSQWYDQAKFIGGYQQFKESRHDRNFGESILFETFERVQAVTTNINFSKGFGAAELYYGLEYIYNKVNSRGQQTNIDTGMQVPDASRYPDDSTWQSMAAYSSLQWKLNPTLNFQGGLRYSHVLLDAEFDPTFFDFPFSSKNLSTGALTGSAGLAWNPNKVLGWKLNFSTAFRAPNIDDVGKIFDSEPGSVVVPNPDLEAEYAYTGEIGASINFNDVVIIDVATYYTVLDDALVRRDFSINGETEIIYQGELSNVQAIQNAGIAEVYGFEAGLQVNFTSYLKLLSQFNITDGFIQEDDGSEAPVRHAAPPFGNTHLIFNKNKITLDFYGEYNGQFDFEDLAPSQQNNAFLYATDGNGNPFSPSWYTLNFGAQYKLSNAWLFTANVENLTDQRYRQYSSGIAAPGRNLIMAVQYSF